MLRILSHSLVCLGLSLGLMSMGLAEPPEGYPFHTYDEALRLAQQQQRKVFLYFGRYGCPWCDKTNKQTFSDESLRKLYGAHYVLAYVDAESGRRLSLPSGERLTEMELGARLKVYATPVFVFLEPEGAIILKVPGFKTVKDFQDYDRFVQSGAYRRQSLLEFLAGDS